MAKIDVILIQNVAGLGTESDQVKVASGYARNYLIPEGLAIPVTQANARRLEALKKRRAEREALEIANMTELAKVLEKLVLNVSVKTNEAGTKMYGSITSATIADELKAQYDIALDKHKINIEKPIRTIGENEVLVKLHQTIEVTLKVNVKSTNPVVAEAAAPVAETK